MGLLKNIIDKFKGNQSEFKVKLRQAQENAKIERIIEERVKSSNERELESHYKKMREESIKRQLDKIHKQQNQSLWKGNILSNQTSILRNDMPILNNDHSILRDNSVLINKRGRGNSRNLFFRY